MSVIRQFPVNLQVINSGIRTIMYGGGQLVVFKQEVELEITGYGQLIEFQQEVINDIDSEALVTFIQVVIDG